VKRHPPDRDPEGFRRIREAYDLVRDERRLAEIRLFGTPGIDRLADIARSLSDRRRAVGPGPWLRALAEGPP
jgi:hypothetical protein